MHTDIVLEKNTCFISGDLQVFNVMSVYEKSLTLFSQLHELRIDFSRLDKSDSTGVALLIEWIKFAKDQKKPIQFFNIPKHLLTIANAARMESLLSSVTTN